nr:molecular chaperone TorD family protein [Rhodovibrio salinarum]
MRANVYILLAQLLARAPQADLLQQVAGLQGDDSPFGEAMRALAHQAQRATPDQIADEHFNLFIGVGESELVPYGSYYLTGFLNEKPLARLRADMAELGIARADGVHESEDHIAALCEIMAGLITGAFGDAADLSQQRRFFQQHIGCWAPRFFEDLEAAAGAAFYMPVGSIGRLFMEVESEAFEMAA